MTTRSEVDASPAIALYFKVVIDGRDMGAFISCDGLSVEVVTVDREEGGNNGFVWKLPVRVKYSNIKLTRPIGPDSARVAAWIAGMSSHFTRTTARITALTPMGQELVSWSLDGVIPVRWDGPGFNAESVKVAQETLELAHHGFRYEDQGSWD